MNSDDIFQAAAKASPPILYVGVKLMGVSLPDWVAIATLIYIALQTGHLLWRWWRAAHRNSGAGD